MSGKIFDHMIMLCLFLVMAGCIARCVAKDYAYVIKTIKARAAR